jgi:hypothetical protein
VVNAGDAGSVVLKQWSTHGANAMVTYRLSRLAADGRRRLELQGQRLLVGHADTGIFRIAVLAVPRPSKIAARAPQRCRDDGDGLAPASVEICAPLALVDEAP